MSSDFITLGLDGRLLADEEQVGERLRGMTGRFRWMPSAPDAVLLVRAPAQGGVSSAPRVALMGDLAFTSLAEILEFLHQGRKTGTLRAVLSGGERAVVLHEGSVRGAFSDSPEDSLSETCLRLGLVSRTQVEQVAAAQPGHARVGRALVEAGALSSHDLFKAVQHQVGEIVAAMLVAREGLFVFVDESVEERAIPGVQLNAQGLLMDAIRRIDEMAQFRSRLPSGKLYLVRRKPAGPQLVDDERKIYDLCNGSLTLLDIAREMRMGEFDATKIVYHLLQGGYVQASPNPAPVEAAKRNDPADVSRVFHTIFREVVGSVATHGDPSSFLTSANAALAKEAGRSPFLASVTLSTDGSLDWSTLTQQIAATGGDGASQARSVFTALSEVMFFLLFQAGEVLTPQEDEALARRVKELLASVEPG